MISSLQRLVLFFRLLAVVKGVAATPLMNQEQLDTCNQKNATADEPICQDTNSNCHMWATEGECQDNSGYMLVACPCSCNSCPTYTKNDWDDEPQMAMGPLKEEIEYRIHTTEEYMRRFQTYFSFGKIQNCRNKHQGCTHWSLLGECHFNPSFMMEDCAAACLSCHKSKPK